MMNCHDATLLLSQRRDRKLTFSERMRLRLHTGICRGCAEFGHQLPLIGGAARTLAGSEEAGDA